MAVVNGDRNNVSRATVPAPRTFVVALLRSFYIIFLIVL